MKYEITFINEQKYPKKTQLSQTFTTTASSFKDLEPVANPPTKLI